MLGHRPIDPSGDPSITEVFLVLEYEGQPAGTCRQTSCLRSNTGAGAAWTPAVQRDVWGGGKTAVEIMLEGGAIVP